MAEPQGLLCLEPELGCGRRSEASAIAPRLVANTHYACVLYRCYYLILGKPNQLIWESARERCKEQGGDLLVFRSDQEVEHT